MKVTGHTAIRDMGAISSVVLWRISAPAWLVAMSIAMALVSSGLAWGQAGTPGPVRQTKPPPKSIQQTRKEAIEQHDRDVADARRRDQERNENQLLEKYPDLASIRGERDKLVEPLRANQRASRARREELLIDRKPLLEQAEFYRGKPLPSPLQQKFDTNDGQLAGQRTALIFNLDRESDLVAEYRTLHKKMVPLWAKLLVRDAPSAAGQSRKPG